MTNGEERGIHVDEVVRLTNRSLQCTIISNAFCTAQPEIRPGALDPRDREGGVPGSVYCLVYQGEQTMSGDIISGSLVQRKVDATSDMCQR
jgi:hypothetical protein